MRNMGGLRHRLPWTFALMWIATLAIAGIPPLSGFFSKDEILAAAFARGQDAPLWYLFWGLGVAAALLTAFYMTRMMRYTFHGPNRTGERAEPQLREAPWVMTGPLVVLGVLAAVGGLLNLPALVGGGRWLHHWLEPVTAGAAGFLPDPHLEHGTELLLVGGAIAVALAGIGAAFRLLDPGRLVPAREAPPEAGIGRLLWRKWYVDEVYDTVIVRPLMWLSRNVLWRFLDQGVVDGAGVNGAAWLSRLLGRLGSRLQTGEVALYVVVFVIGVVVVLRAAGS
jgi:NADH-quinone oxidoreductase subunit L